MAAEALRNLGMRVSDSGFWNSGFKGCPGFGSGTGNGNYLGFRVWKTKRKSPGCKISGKKCATMYMGIRARSENT